MEKETIGFYVLLGLSVISVIAALLSVNLYLIILAVLLEGTAVFVYRFWFVFDTLVFRHTNLIQVFDGYELSGERRCAIRRINGKVSVTCASVLDTTGSSEIDRQKIENIISHIDYPFKFTMQVERLDYAKIIDRLQTKRNMKEIELTRLSGARKRDPGKESRIKREIEQLEHDIKSIGFGQMPLKAVYYIFTTAVSESKYDAEEKAKSQIRELTSQFDALLNSKGRIVNGTELLDIMKIDSSMVLV